MAVRQLGMAGLTKSLTAAGPPKPSIPALIPGQANVAAGTSDEFPTLAQSRPVRRRSAELRLDLSACIRRSPSPGFDTHGYRPRPSDDSTDPTRAHKH